MAFLKKIKSFFFEGVKEPEIQPLVVAETPQPFIPEQKGETIAQCILCTLDIGSEDRTRDLNGNKVHKRCHKKAISHFLSGKSLEEIAEQIKGGGIK